MYIKNSAKLFSSASEYEKKMTSLIPLRALIPLHPLYLQQGEDRQHRRARTGQLEQDSKNGTARAGHPKQYRQNRTGTRTGRTG
jgi:hypothetical protein